MYKKFVLKTLLLITLFIFTIAIFNWLIDPFDIFNSPKIDGLNVNKVSSYPRTYKAFHLKKLKPEIIFLGTSRTEGGLDPKNKNIKKVAYNCAFTIGLPFEYEFFAKRAITFGAKHIIIGADLFAFYAKDRFRSDFDLDAFSDNDFKLLKYLISISALKSSIKTIFSNLSNENKILTSNSTMIMQNSAHLKATIAHEKDYYKNYYSKDFNRNQTIHWEAFERILDMAHKEDVNVTVFISPSHARLWEVLDITQGWEIFEEFRRKLVEINERVAKKHNKEPFSLWDFAGYHELTTEPFPKEQNGTMKYYFESSHYTKELGDIVLDRIFGGNFYGGQNYPDFGVVINSQNIESHLANLKESRKLWQSQNKEIIDSIRALKK